jgi:hypothetical protein
MHDASTCNRRCDSHSYRCLCRWLPLARLHAVFGQSHDCSVSAGVLCQRTMILQHADGKGLQQQPTFERATLCD